MEEGKCINCGDPSGLCWFCPPCIKVKQKAYAESAELKENWVDVIIRRDAALAKFKREKSFNAA